MIYLHRNRLKKCQVLFPKSETFVGIVDFVAPASADVSVDRQAVLRAVVAVF